MTSSFDPERVLRTLAEHEVTFVLNRDKDRRAIPYLYALAEEIGEH